MKKLSVRRRAGGNPVEPLESRRLLSATVTGVVWLDSNANGRHDAGEPGVANRPVWIDLNNDFKYEPGEPATATNANGAYTFPNVADNTIQQPLYIVRQYLPPGFIQTFRPNNWGEHVTITNGSISLDGVAGTGADFGTASAATPGISGIVFNDINNNGAQNSGEAAIANQSLWLDLNNDGKYETNEPATTTAGDGTYQFIGLSSGTTYNVRYYTPPGFHQTTPAGNGAQVVTFNGSSVTGRDFGVAVGASSTPNVISGIVFNDINNNGAQNAGEGALPGQHVWVDLNNNGKYDPGEPAATTDASGAFAINGLTNGNYIVRYYTPPGFHQTTPANSGGLSASLTGGTVGNLKFGVAGGAA